MLCLRRPCDAQGITKINLFQDIQKANDSPHDAFGYLLKKAKLESEYKFVNEKNVIHCELCFDIDKIDCVKNNEKEFGVIRTNLVEEPKTVNDPLRRTF